MSFAAFKDHLLLLNQSFYRFHCWAWYYLSFIMCFFFLSYIECPPMFYTNVLLLYLAKYYFFFHFPSSSQTVPQSVTNHAFFCADHALLFPVSSCLFLRRYQMIFLCFFFEETGFEWEKSCK